MIVPPFRIPAQVNDMPSDDHEFCIRFFGNYNFGWVGRSSVHFYSKNDVAKLLTKDPKQKNAFDEASKWFDKMPKHIANNNNSIMDFEKNKIPSKSQGDILQTPHYVKITTIHVVAPAKQKKSKDEPTQCSCRSDNPCGPSSRCENREMSIECGPTCSMGSNCKNQCFERKAHAAVKVVFMDPRKGFGLIADEFIHAGTLVMEYVGELITEQELQRRKTIKMAEVGAPHVYFMAYTNGLYVDAEKKGNEARFVNHSCNPNCETQKWTVNRVDRIGYFAVKDIEKVKLLHFMFTGFLL